MMSPLSTQRTGNWFPPGTEGKTFAGRTDIGSFWQGGMDIGLRPLKLTTGRVVRYDELIVENSTYSHGKGRGSYQVVWRNVGGRWQLFTHIFN